jgi:ABC-type phosphonate transport system ATPase subunit
MNARIQHVELHAEDDGLTPGDVMLKVDNVSLSFGGVKAISDISFDILKGEIRAIIGPERGRQDLDAQRDQRLLSSAGRGDHIPRQGPLADAAL